MNAIENDKKGPAQRAAELVQALEAFGADLEGRETLTGAETACIDAFEAKYQRIEEPGEFIVDRLDAIAKGIKLQGRPGIEYLGRCKNQLAYIRRTLNA